MRGWSVPWRLSVALALAMSVSERGDAQTPNALDSQYFSNGADVTTVSPSNGPASTFFSNGADVMTVYRPGQNFANYFTSGASMATSNTDLSMTQGERVTTVPPDGDPGGEYFSNGASATSVPRSGEIGAEFYSNGAAVTSVPKKGEPGAEFFSNGVRPFLSDPALQPKPPVEAATPSEPATPEQPPEAERESTDETAPVPEAAPPDTTEGTPSQPPAGDSSQGQTTAPRTRTLATIVDTLAVGAVWYLAALLVLASVLILGVTWRIRRKRRERRPRLA
jgi:hypothetical protein